MDITPLVATSTKIIDSYGVGFFRVNKEKLHGNLLVSPEDARAWQEEFTSANITEILARYLEEKSLQPKVILIGTGKEHISGKWLHSLKQTWPFIEAMSTPAACRTYNTLVTEGREVCAVLCQFSE